MKRAVLIIGFLMSATATFACPVCDTETGRQVREGIFGPDFGITLLSVLAPFPVLLAIIGAAYWSPDLLKRKSFNRQEIS